MCSMQFDFFFYILLLYTFNQAIASIQPFKNQIIVLLKKLLFKLYVNLRICFQNNVLKMLQFDILQVPGNFHISTHGSREQPQKPDMTHTIKELRIGDRYLVTCSTL